MRLYFRADAAFAKPEVYLYLEEHRGQLFSRVGFVVTNLSAKPEGVVHFYNRRGTAEQWIKEGKYALNWTRPLLPPVCCQPGAAAAFHLGLQSG